MYFGTGRLSDDQVGGGNKFHSTSEITALKLETGGMMKSVGTDVKTGVGLLILFGPCLPRQGYLMFRLIIEYSSLRDFGP